MTPAAVWEDIMSNMNVTRRALAAAAIALSLAATAALAQQPGRIRGQIEKVDGDMLVLKTRDGAMLNVKLDEKARVSALVKACLLYTSDAADEEDSVDLGGRR